MARPCKKGRAIVEVDTDDGYVLNNNTIEETSKVKHFNNFFDDIKHLLDSHF